MVRKAKPLQSLLDTIFPCFLSNQSAFFWALVINIRRNVAELDLLIESDDDGVLLLSKSLFTCKTLTVLKLWWSKCMANMPTSGCFQCLKVLHVTFQYPQNHSVEELFSHCPVLEDLTIDGDLGEVFNFNISAPELKRLRISLRTSYDLQDAHTFFVNAPKLQKVHLNVGLMSKYILEDTKSLVEAKIYANWHYQDDEQYAFSNRMHTLCMHKLLAGISTAKYLYFSAHIFKGGSLPAFC